MPRLDVLIGLLHCGRLNFQPEGHVPVLLPVAILRTNCATCLLMGTSTAHSRTVVLLLVVLNIARVVARSVTLKAVCHKLSRLQVDLDNLILRYFILRVLVGLSICLVLLADGLLLVHTALEGQKLPHLDAEPLNGCLNVLSVFEHLFRQLQRLLFHPLDCLEELLAAVIELLEEADVWMSREEVSVHSLLTKLALEDALAVEWNVVNKLNLGFLEGVQYLDVVAVKESQQRQKVL